MIPTVAILGRPNVGKSTLFNRLVGARRAIVDARPGVTRDRIEGEARLGGLRFRVLDTAGLELSEDELGQRLRQQSLAALKEADVVLFLVDAQVGLTPLDEELAELLRRAGRPVIPVANKCESASARAFASELWGLGLGEPVAISARHGRGFDELAAALRPHLRPHRPTQEPAEDAAGGGAVAAEAPAAGVAAADIPAEGVEAAADEGEGEPIRIAVVGRPNTGKSSLVNRLLGEERLLTGPTPGLTRDAVDVPWSWRGHDFVLVDTAGLRKRARIDDRLEKISAARSLEAVRRADVAILVLDARMPLERQDAAIARYATERGRPLVVALNKWDLVEDPAAVGALVRERVERRLSAVEGVPVVPVSALTGRGLERLLQAVVTAHARWRRRIPTGALNRWLEEALRRHPPPSVDGRRAKIRYATQVDTRPPHIVLFANRPALAMPRSYLRYLAKELRAAFDLGGIPLRLETRAGDNPYAPARSR